MNSRTRRQALAGLASASIVSLAGCSDALSEVSGGPDPRVTDTESGQSIGDALTGSAEIRVLVVNDGDSGDVEVTVKTSDSNGNTLDKFTQTVTIQEGESRRVDFNVSPSDGAQRYEATAEAA
ncbi:hypothetical protein ACFQJ7_13895 [Halovenus rubra]|uniref:Uncharacterized protein n=2 Tax=Halovenus rubra TaxID=869890 RepID=A0ACC7DZS9_9EURY|nr:hypothetical protein [Halovenus rubra]